MDTPTSAVKPGGTPINAAATFNAAPVPDDTASMELCINLGPFSTLRGRSQEASPTAARSISGNDSDSNASVSTLRSIPDSSPSVFVAGQAYRCVLQLGRLLLHTARASSIEDVTVNYLQLAQDRSRTSCTWWYIDDFGRQQNGHRERPCFQQGLLHELRAPSLHRFA